MVTGEVKSVHGTNPPVRYIEVHPVGARKGLKRKVREDPRLGLVRAGHVSSRFGAVTWAAGAGGSTCSGELGRTESERVVSAGWGQVTGGKVAEGHPTAPRPAHRLVHRRLQPRRQRHQHASSGSWAWGGSVLAMGKGLGF